MIGDFKIVKQCSTTNARVSSLELNTTCLDLPIFMPVGTHGAMKGIPVENICENMILTNAYHLRALHKNIKEFMGYNLGMLTDSGGFQIGSLSGVIVAEDGILFGDDMFTPEDSMNVQMELGADIIMQLDDVANPCEPIERIEEAMRRSLRWLDRCINAVKVHGFEEEKKQMKEDDVPQIEFGKNGQILFPIVQGGVYEDLRMESITEIMRRSPKGIAIGGLSGGEEKVLFAKTVYYCINKLPKIIPRYVMGVGYPEDIVVCVALGSDMFDCVYPTRTARFGNALSDSGDVYFTSKLLLDTKKIDSSCSCYTCENHTRAFLYSIKGTTNFCILLTIHNLYYMRNLTKRIRDSILEDRYPEFVKFFMKRRFGDNIPTWIKIALEMVGIEL